MITSFVDGRVRIRAKALKNPETMAAVKDVVAGQDGILSTHGNVKTGSLLVIYDPAIISREHLARAAELLGEQIGAATPPPSPAARCFPLRIRAGRQQESILLGTLYALTLAGGFMKNMRVHLAAGAAFTLLAAAHVYKRRRCL